MSENSKVVLITGITGQDGSYLAELLLSKEYIVHGIIRPSIALLTNERYYRISNILEQIHLHFSSIEDYHTLRKIIAEVNPDECYHLAANSGVEDSFKYEQETMYTNINGTYNILSILHQVCPHCKVYFAASSEMFGRSTQLLQTELTPFNPVSPYGISKVTGFHLAKYYRQLGMFICCGILFNHESPRRAEQFLSKKIVQSVVNIKKGSQTNVHLGNLQAERDWGYAKDYVLAMWLMLQQSKADDYVIATGETHSVREFVNLAFQLVNLNYQKYVIIDKNLYRPLDIHRSCGDATKAKERLGWKPRIDFLELILLMVQTEMGGKKYD
jgi:GDPmannose 4,6-dehydratase